MPRVGPNYTLPEPPFVPQTPISSAAMNSDLQDIADALTGSLARNGAGGMTAVLPLANDGLTFTNDPDTGISRSSANTMSFECGNSEVASISTTGMAVTGTISATGAISQNGFPLLPVGLGPLPWSGTTAPAGWVLCKGQTLSRTTFATLWAFAQTEIAAGNTFYTNGNGTTTFGIGDLRGRTIAGVDDGAGRLTSTYFGADPTKVGSGGGGESQTLTVAQTAAHFHNANISDSGHQHSFTAAQFVSNTIGLTGSSSQQVNLSSVSTGSSTTGVRVTSDHGNDTTFSTGGGQPHPNVQPTMTMNYILFAGV